MHYIAISLIAIWICGLLVLAGTLLNDMRIVANNLKPGASFTRPDFSKWLKLSIVSLFVWPVVCLLWLSLVILDYLRFLANALIPGARFSRSKFTRWDYYRTSNTDPELLNEIGRSYLQRADRNEWLMFTWVGGGVILIIWASSYF